MREGTIDGFLPGGRALEERAVRMFSKVAIDTPAGMLVAAARGQALCALTFSDHWRDGLARLERRFGAVEFVSPFPESLEAALNAYFRGDLDAIDGLEVDVDGTDFQMRVWRALRTIPAGQTLSYRDLARRMGRKEAVRAVGNANGENPVGLVIPCHRVVHADGTLGGYGGGVARKQWLLAHEGASVKVRPLRQA